MSKKILIVDDEPDILRPYLFRLRKLGYETLSATNGKDALETARSHKPDLILLDIKLPIFNGYEVCERLKADEVLGKIPIIFLTADASVGIEEGTKKAKAAGYLLKPFDMNQLLEKMKELIP